MTDKPKMVGKFPKNRWGRRAAESKKPFKNKPGYTRLNKPSPLNRKIGPQ